MNVKSDLKYSTSILVSSAIISILLIGINYFTIKVLSSIRAYAHGESQYSKGQKDATRNLLLFIESKDTTYYQKFLDEISVPIGDSIARVALTVNMDRKKARAGFLQGRNHPDDVDRLIWLLVKFQDFEFMEEPLEAWRKGDITIGKIADLGSSAYQKIRSNNLTSEEEIFYINKAVAYTNEATIQERKFLDSLGKTSRSVNGILFIANFVLTGLLLGAIGFYSWSVVKKISKQKQDLNRLNKQLDEFLYSATHDLRAPISSLKGLIHIAKVSNNPTEIHEYMNMMYDVLEKQEGFIKQIMDVSKNEKIETQQIPVNFEDMVEKALQYHQHMPQATNVQFKKDISAKSLLTDPLRIEIIFNNLLSNAIKYSDSTKAESNIKITSYIADKHFVFAIEDNGIGIDTRHLDNIFDIFYVANQNKTGSGVGLYLTRETVRKIGGEIKVESRLHVGTKFTVSIPCQPSV